MFFISDALAEAAPAAAQQPNMIATFLPLILIFAVMYFLLIRPQQRQRKEKGKKLLHGECLLIMMHFVYLKGFRPQNQGMNRVESSWE